MYDSLLEEFDDDAVRTPEEEDGFAVQAVAEIDIAEDDGELDVVDAAADVDVPLKLDEEELLSLSDDNESWSDDPVRMYLTQMGEIPLLTREQEISLAKKIEITRKPLPPQGAGVRLRACSMAVEVLKRVHAGELPFDRTVKVSVTEHLEKDQILGRLPHNLRTLEHLLERNRRRLPRCVQQVATSRAPQGCLDAPRAAAAARRSSWSKSFGLRTQQIQPLMKQLEQIQPPDGRAEAPDRRAQARQGPRRTERKPAISELRDILLITLETPDQPAQPRVEI